MSISSRNADSKIKGMRPLIFFAEKVLGVADHESSNASKVFLTVCSVVVGVLIALLMAL